MNCTVREAKPGDVGAILHLYGQLQPNDPAPPSTASDVFTTICASPHLHLFVLDVDGETLATSYLNVIPNMTRSASPYAVIENVVVNEHQRGKGLGKRIVKHTLDRAWCAGCYKVMLMTGSKRDETHAFYRACGFSSADKVGYVARPPVPY